MHFKIFVFCSLIFTLYHTIAHAEQRDSSIGIYIDQDLFVPFTNEDRDYTMGIAFEFFGTDKKGFYPLDKLVAKTAKLLNIKNADNVTYSYMFGLVTYTPDDLTNIQPIYNDRPYSSLVYLSNKRIFTNNKEAIAAEVLLGLIGTNMSKEVQSGLHSISRKLNGTNDPIDPQGWDHQISEGGELTMRVRVSKAKLQLSESGYWDIATTTGLSLGFQTNANVSVAFRLGNIKSPFWSLPFDPVNRGNFVPASPNGEWYFWSAFRAHLVGYDTLLQGQFRHSDVTFKYDEIEHVVYDGALGLTLGFDKSQLTFSVNVKTSDLKLTSRRQVWGSLNYLFHF